MPNSGDTLIIDSSNGLSLRDGPDMRGTTIRKLGNESRVTVLPVTDEVQSPHEWAYVRTEDGIDGWIVVRDDRGKTYVKMPVLNPYRPLAKRPRKRKRRN